MLVLEVKDDFSLSIAGPVQQGEDDITRLMQDRDHERFRQGRSPGFYVVVNAFRVVGK